MLANAQCFSKRFYHPTFMIKSFQRSVRLLLGEVGPLREKDDHVCQLKARTFGNVQEVREFLVRSAAGTFGDVVRHAQCCATQLFGIPKQFQPFQVIRKIRQFSGQFDCVLPDGKVLESKSLFYQLTVSDTPGQSQPAS